MPPSDVLSPADAAHLLRRVGFGGSNAEIASLTGLTRQQAVDLVTDLSGAPGVTRPFASGEQRWEAHVRAHGWWLDRMVTTPKPLQEKLALFWHSHFATGARKVGNMVASWDHVQMLRAGCMGGFETLCQQTAISPAMLVYLDNETNVVGAEQENFARELMELHTVGVGDFSESDVIAMAKAWTGFNTRREHFGGDDISHYFAAGAHDNSQKTLMGTTQNWSGPDSIVELCFGAGRTATSRHVTRKLWRFLVQTNPSGATIDAVASTFSSSNLDIGTLVRTILLHDEFWAAGSRHALVKSPVEFMVDLMRRFGIRVDVAGDGNDTNLIAADSVFWRMGFTGQVLFEPPNVNGWGVGSSWLSTATMWARARLCQSIRWRVGEMDVFGDPDHPSALRNMAPAAGVQRILDQMGIDAPSAATRSRLEAWFTTLRAQDSWAIHPNAVMVGGLCPEFQLT
ncbi:MAG: DUF1800 domain-containing protein [Ilumatobacteraceae bacterium]